MCHIYSLMFGTTFRRAWLTVITSHIGMDVKNNKNVKTW